MFGEATGRLGRRTMAIDVATKFASEHVGIDVYGPENDVGKRALEGRLCLTPLEAAQLSRRLAIEAVEKAQQYDTGELLKELAPRLVEQITIGRRPDDVPAASSLDELQTSVIEHVERLWPGESLNARLVALVEEVGEVGRAILKRDHARKAIDGKCRGLTVAEWSDNLKEEAGQALVVLLTIAELEHFSLYDAAVRAGQALAGRQPG